MVVFRRRAIRLKGGLNALGFYVHRGEVKALGEGYDFHFIFIYFLERKMESKGGLNALGFYVYRRKVKVSGGIVIGGYCFL